MNKSYIEGVVVVEGKSDVSYLSSFIDSLWFITNGYDINQEKLEFLKRVSEVQRIIVLTDNDEAGMQIENKIKSEIPCVFTVKTSKNIRKNYKKAGVAETDKEVILRALDQFIGSKKQVENYNLTNIISLSSNPEEIRKQIVNNYRLINGNNKYIENQLRMLKVNAKEFNKKYGN